MKIKYLLLVGVVAIGFFAFGAYTIEKKSWPYQLLAQLDEVVTIRNRLVRPDLVIDSQVSPLDVSSLIVATEVPIESRGGGIYAFDDKVLIMSYRGEFFLYQNEDGEKSVKKLDIEIDNGYPAFRDFVARNEFDISENTKRFRFIDVIYDRQSSPPSLFVSHDHWHEDDLCYTLRLSKLELDPDRSLETDSAASAEWQNVYDTTPCLTMTPKAIHLAQEAGGRFVLENPNSVLLTVGDRGFDGWNRDHIHAQDKSSDVGKIIRIDLETGTASHVTIGNRNSQGLMIDRDGTIWSTEHGPKGGDELNIVRQDMNYGWPYVTYGSEYNMRYWPLSANQNRHDGYARPEYAWVPSIGISNLIQIDGFMPEWDGDLLVSSLTQRALHRLRYREGRVIFDESIHIGLRIRDLDQLADDTIVLWTDDTSIIELRPVKPGAPRTGDVVDKVQ